MKYEKAQYFAKEVYVEMTKAIRKSSIQPTKKDQVIKKLRSNIDEEEDPEKIYSLLFDSQSEAKFLEILCEYMGKKQAEPLAKELHLQMTTG